VHTRLKIKTPAREKQRVRGDDGRVDGKGEIGQAKQKLGPTGEVSERVPERERLVGKQLLKVVKLVA